MVEIESGIKRKQVFSQPRVDGEFFASGLSKEPSQKCKAFRSKGKRNWPVYVGHKDAKLAVPMPVFNRLTRRMVAEARRWGGGKAKD